MQDHATRAIEAALGEGARYVEARATTRLREVMGFKDGAVDSAYTERDRGLGVRALVGDGWGFAATNALAPDDLVRCAQQAVAAARATAEFATAEVAVPAAVAGRYQSVVREDPFAISAEEKAALFGEAHRAVMTDPRIVGARGTFIGQRTETTFLASNGTSVAQAVTLCGGGITAIARVDGEVQVRSAPKSHEGNILQAGFEALREAHLERDAERLRDEAIALAMAAPAPAGPTTVILDGDQLSLQLHESIGHPTELDRALGHEISLAGASFLLPQMLDGFEFGAPIVNVVADSTHPTGPGTFGFDDEGTPAGRAWLVRDGRFVGYLSGRDSARQLGRNTTGCMRAENWAAVPIVRMVNISLEPGSGSLDDLIAGVDDGLLLATNKSWSIDDLRLNFQFGCEIAYELKGGKRTGRIFRNPVYRGITPEFWRSCSAIAGPEAWRMWGWMFCGKGDPIQVIHVGHGCAPARFDGVHVRSTGT